MSATEMEVMLRKFENEYPWKHMEKLPEFCMNKINKDGIGNNRFDNLPEDALENLPESNLRTRSQIIQWMNKYLTYETLMYAGW
tara:strand:+ start:1363 stop:1614 length:252 start_codon:yes stop_codon:yes gene_type:complete